MTDTEKSASKSPLRLASIDIYRGLVMFLLFAESLHLAQVATKVPDSPVWKFLAYHQEHVEWIGCSLHDLIQPSFSFLVGAAMAFSIVNRQKRGQSGFALTMHALWRSIALVFLGVFLRSMGSKQTNFTFEDTLSQIGLGYFFLYLISFRPIRDRWIALAVILVGYWIAFAAYPAPGPDFDYDKVKVTEEFKKDHWETGLASHWNKNTNPAWAFDSWFLNQFPRSSPFEANSGGYSTLSFIPTLGTMILGLIAGGILLSQRSGMEKFRWLLIAGASCLALGYILGLIGVCPVVKRIWTPSWTLFSGGWCLLILAALHGVADNLGWKAWGYPLTIMGMNSIAAYCMGWLFKEFIRDNLNVHFKTLEILTGKNLYLIFGDPYQPLVQGACIMLVMWLMLFWMHCRKIYLRI